MRLLKLLSPLLFVAAIGCDKDQTTQTPGGDGPCPAGATRACPCVDGAQGVQRCADGGGMWEACACQTTGEFVVPGGDMSAPAPAPGQDMGADMSAAQAEAARRAGPQIAVLNKNNGGAGSGDMGALPSGALAPDAGVAAARSASCQLQPITDVSERALAAGLYAQRCASCHGDNGRGTPSGSDILDDAGEDSDQELRDVIMKGAGEMPPIAVTAHDADRIISYTLWLAQQDGISLEPRCED